MSLALKPQDVVVLIKLFGYRNERPPYSAIAEDVKMSQSEVLNAVRRLRSSRLLQSVESKDVPVLDAIEEFLIHGVKYAFPAKHGSIVRGIPTSYAAEPLSKIILAGNEPIPVWPYPKGRNRGLSLLPLYKTVPEAVQNDPVLYERLALIDAIRSGLTRERKLAEDALIKSLRNHG
ncbi:MAG TPA: hypothetical protein VFM90_08960 [Cyclobacteriaceae bacterium]|nr:hypothetical protein [Cyclobacteriaceae bacterium]